MEWVYRNDLCWKAECYHLKTKVVYDEKTRTRKCPRCGEIEKYSEEEWKDLQSLRGMLYDYMPGKYLFKDLSSEKIADFFLRKIDKREWTLYLAHDYVLAKMRRDLESQRRMKEAMKIMALKMDYDVKGCQTMFPMLDDLAKSCDHVPHMIFDTARKNFRVEGWREREEETVYEAYKRNLHVERTKENELFKREEWLWSDAYYSALHDMYSCFRINGDRVACWVTRELLKKVEYMIRGDSEIYYDVELDPFPDGLIEDVLEGRVDTRDLQELTVQWYLKQAEAYVGRNSDVVDEAVLAVATRLGWKTVPEIYVRSEYVEELAERLGDPEILQLYGTAKNLDLKEEERLEVAKTLLAKVKGILAVLPSSREKEKTATYVS